MNTKIKKKNIEDIRKITYNYDAINPISYILNLKVTPNVDNNNISYEGQINKNGT